MSIFSTKKNGFKLQESATIKENYIVTKGFLRNFFDLWSPFYFTIRKYNTTIYLGRK